MGETITMEDEVKSYPMLNGIVPEEMQKEVLTTLGKFLVSAGAKMESGGGKAGLQLRFVLEPYKHGGYVLEMKSAVNFAEGRTLYKGTIQDGQLTLSLM